MKDDIALLDRPAWHALRARQAAFAVGDGSALRFQSDVSPFAAAADDDPASLAALAALIPADGVALLLQAGTSPVPPGTVAERVVPGVQMVAEQLVPERSLDGIVMLGDADAAEMRTLATLTEPGPFLPRTHELGGFLGIREGGRLVAMAGERMKPGRFTEVSGVCTHPDFRGRGYAGRLSRAVATRILDRGEIPFLHAVAANTPAIALYETLGFRLRVPVTVTVLRRDPDAARYLETAGAALPSA